MNRRLSTVLAGATLALLASCAPGTPQLMPMETLFPLELGTLEDQIDLFQRDDLSSPEPDRFLFYNGLILVSDGNARKIMEFSSYGDLLAVYYNPDSNPVPALVGAAASSGTPGQVRNRRAFAYPFNELGEIALTNQNQLYVEDRIPVERRTYDPDLEGLLESRILRFDKDGKFLDFLGQEGIGGTPFPRADRVSVTSSGELVIICRTQKGWAIWWYDPAGNPVDKVVLPNTAIPLPEGEKGSGTVAEIESVFPDWRDRTLHLKVDYYRQSLDPTTKTSSGIQLTQTRLWNYDLRSQRYEKSFQLASLRRQRAEDEVSEPLGDRPYAFLGLNEGGQLFFLSAPEAGSQRFLVLRPDGSTVLERNIELGGADSLFGQYTVTRTGVLVGFLSDGNRVQLAWWRSDKLLGTYAQTGF